MLYSTELVNIIGTRTRIHNSLTNGD